MMMIIPENILIPDEYLINLSKSILENKKARASMVRENPTVNSSIFMVLYSRFPMEAL